MIELQIDNIKKWLGSGSINIFGSPFSGKDTQGRKLTEVLNAKLIGGGEILRSSITPEHIQEHLSTGELTPTEDYLKIVLPYLEKPEYRQKPLILSAVGRWKGEEDDVIEATKQAGHPLKAVIFLNLSEDAVWNRWEQSDANGSRGKRSDDSEDTLRVRMREYTKKTLPVIKSYKDKGLLIEVNGNCEANKVGEEIISKLASIARDQA
jgi:adenylate kinase